MQRPGNDANRKLRERIERARARLPIGQPPPPRVAAGRGGRPTPVRRRRVSRAARDAQRQRQVRLGMTLVGALVALILVGGLVNEYVIKPRAVLATVGGTEIRRRDYWKARAVGLVEEANQLQQVANFVGPDQRQQYLQTAAQRLAEVDDVWGSTDVDDPSLQRMIDDQLYLQNLDELGLSVTAPEVESHILQQFDPQDAPLVTPTPEPTLIPARAALATQTATALETAPTVAAGTPDAAPTNAALPPPPNRTPLAGAASPPASPDASPPPSATPNPDQARATAVAGYEQFRDNVFGEANISEADYERLIARPAVAREKIDAALAAQIGQSAEQVHAAHILVGTRDLAQSLSDQIGAGTADFAQVARDQSTDEGTAGNGGDLGWFAREEMVPPFAEAAFALQPGQISLPVETEFGWHLIRVDERAADRPLSDQQIDRLRQTQIDRWLEERRAETRISSDLDPTPTPGAESFAPPVEAPSPPPPPIASPIASPGLGLPPDPFASPVPLP